MSDTNISVCSKLCPTILQCILSLITVLLKWCFFLIWITSFIFNCSGYWKLFSNFIDGWMSSLLCETHHFSVSLCKNTFTCEKSIHSTLSATPSYLMWLEDSHRRQPNAMDIFDKFITKTSPGKIEDSSSRKGNLGVHDSIEWLISSMSLQFYIKLPWVPLKLFFGESILGMTHTGENSFYCTFSVWW